MLRSHKIEYSYQLNAVPLNNKIMLLIPDDSYDVIIRISKTILIHIGVSEGMFDEPLDAIAKHAIKQYHSKVLNQDITKLKIKSVN